jgi:N-acetylmuramoyl-L-alanine amidase-like
MIKKIITLLFLSAVFVDAQIYSPQDVQICKSKFKMAFDKNLENEPIGDVIAAVGKSFIGTDYVAHTLEKGKRETLVINLTGLDCTTFLENAFVFARCIKEKDTTFAGYEKELTKVRYRNEKVNGYASRLNYFSDWIYFNQKKGFIKDVTKEIGGELIKFHVDYMSTHPDQYVQLKNDSSIIPIIEKQELAINKRDYYYIPQNRIADVESKINTGDLIAITTNIKGLDIAHVGIAVREKDGRIHLLNAPDVGYKVSITKEPLADHLAKFKKETGIIVLRAVEPVLQ